MGGVDRCGQKRERNPGNESQCVLIQESTQMALLV